MTGATQQMDLTALLNRGVEEANSHNRVRADEIFLQVLQIDPSNETAVLWRSFLAEDVYRAVAILEEWIARYPQNQHANAYLQQARERCNDVEQLLQGSVTYNHINSSYHQGAKAGSTVLRLGEILLQEGVLTRPQLDSAVRRQQELQSRGFSHRIGQVLVEMGYLTFNQLDQWLDRQSGDYGYRFQD